MSQFIWEPQRGPQTSSLARTEKEILLGGARGGGKTETGIIWVAVPAIATNDRGEWLHPYYRGLVLRRHVDDLKDWVDRSERYYSQFGARKVGRPVEFHFPSGARIYTGHLRDRSAYTKYVGHEYQRLLVEELTLIPLEEMYERILGSCRSKYPDLPPQILLTTNPGNVGHAWVRARFIVDEHGKRRPPGVPFKGRDGNWRIFIPATVDDNPILAQTDPGYVAFLDSLPEALRKAWRYGDWDSFLGAYFPEFRPYGPIGNEEPWANHVVEAGSVRLEPWWHRWMSGDWGFDHPASIHWYCQHPNGQVHVYRELHVRQLGSKELGAALARESAADLAGMPEPFLTLSLDPSTFRQTDAGPTQAEQIAAGVDEALGKGTAYLLGGENELREPKFNDSKPRIIIRQAANARVAGWMNLRDFLRFKKIFPDEAEALPKLQIWDNCEHVIEQLQTMVFDTDGANPEDALKIDAVNGVGGDDACFVAGTEVATESGPKSIEKVRIGDLVWTREGLRPVVAAAMTNPSAKVLEVELSNGTTFIGTANHPIWIKGLGFTRLGSLRCGDVVEPWVERWSQKSLSSTASNTGAIRSPNGDTSESITGRAGITGRRALVRCIVTCGERLTERFRKAITSITRTTIRSITNSRISSAFQALSTSPTTASSGSRTWNVWQGSGLSQRSGIVLRRVWRFIVSMEKISESFQKLTSTANNAVALTRPQFPGSRASAQMRVSRHGGEPPKRTLWRNFAKAVESLLHRTGTISPGSVPVRVVAVRSFGTASVYNLTVSGPHEYYANGILVSNCDSLRYGLMAWKLRQNMAPASVFVMEKLAQLSVKYHGNVDPTIAYMVARNAEEQYARIKKQKASPVTFSRMSGRRRIQVIDETRSKSYGIHQAA